MSHWLIAATAATLSPFVFVWYRHNAQQGNNIGEIYDEVRDAIGSNVPDIREFEHRELTKQLEWRKRPWKDLFLAPPQIDYKGRYY